MASLAVMLKNLGHQVSGSDGVLYPPMSTYLEKNQIPVFQSYKAENIHQAKADLYIIGNVISRGNLELEEVLRLRLPYTSLPEFLKQNFFQDRYPIVIAGTHGKTTTTSLTAHLLHLAGLEPGYYVGGLPGNFSVSAKSGEKGCYFVIEGDEYDTAFYDKRAKFFHYAPHFFLVNNLEFDHGDIYPDLLAIEKTFQLALRLIPSNGWLLLNGTSERVRNLKNFAFCPVSTFGFDQDCDAVIGSFTPKKGEFGYHFTFQWEKKSYTFENQLPGKFNLLNSVAAILIALKVGAKVEQIAKGLDSFVTTQRRLQILTKQKENIVVDDFAHHPTAIQEGVTAIKQHFPEHRLFLIYEPRSNTSLRKFHQDVLGKSFQGADEVFLIQTEKLQKIPAQDRLDFQAVLKEMESLGSKTHNTFSVEEVKEKLLAVFGGKNIFCVMSQGDCGGLPHALAEHFEKK